jgi:hypothetical protein
MTNSFNEWILIKAKNDTKILSEENLSRNYDIKAFVKLPWNWQALHKSEVVRPLFYYAKENYKNGQREQMPDSDFSIISLTNLKGSQEFSSKQTPIPPNELSAANLDTGRPPDLNKFFQLLKSPQTWYDNKIDQVYDSIQMIGKRPEDFGGRDIRKN